ncbi:MAG: CocE/NonD family hydrolase [Kiritimatiellae bacterium]|nr:CocE/NonD family hydrolase [Kiritimatiellia bacterium]
MTSMNQARYKFSIERDIRVPMRDGVHLSTNLFLPEGPGPFPVVFQRLPYGWSGMDLGLYFAPKGYAYLIQDCRGRYDSEGEFYPFVDDAKDGYDSLSWIAAQRWCDGNIGMVGPSYLGATQWLVAPEGHPNLKALIPQVMPTDIWGHCYWNRGAFTLALTAPWLCLEISARTSDMTMANAIDMRKFFNHLPLLTMDELGGRKNQVWRDYITHDTPGEFWDRISLTGKFDKIKAPVFIMGGWYDYHPGEAFRQFAQLREHAPNEELRRAHRIIVGPWDHIWNTKLGELDFSAEGKLDLNDLSWRWFEQHLRGAAPAADGAAAPITIFVMGINQWRTEQEWPLARTRFTKYYLHSKGAAGASPSDGLLDTRAPGDEPADMYVYDPCDPVPTVGGNHSMCWTPIYHIIQPGALDQRGVEGRPDVLVYTSAPLEADLEVTGPVELKLHASSSAPDTDFTVKLVDVYPNGRAMNITEGIIRARYRESLYQAPKLMESGRVYEFTIELQPTSNVFRKGHCIRVDISSSNFPLWDRNLNTGHDIATDTEPRTARQTIKHTAQYPSHIVLPVIPS